MAKKNDLKIQNYFREYSRFHRTKGNKLTHVFGIPLIVLSLFTLLQRTGLTISPAVVLWLSACAYYLSLHLALGVTMIFSTGVLLILATQLSTPLAWALFVAGWVLQGIGHAVYEKRSPAFADNLIHLLIGPAYIQNLFLKIVKYR